MAETPISTIDTPQSKNNELSDNQMDQLNVNDKSLDIGAVESLSPDHGDIEIKPFVATLENIAVTALHVDDDPTLNPWTFRMWFLGQTS
jgi:hypothetical protein